jgi:hypothetical protein
MRAGTVKVLLEGQVFEVREGPQEVEGRIVERRGRASDRVGDRKDRWRSSIWK